MYYALIKIDPIYGFRDVLRRPLSILPPPVLASSFPRSRNFLERASLDLYFIRNPYVCTRLVSPCTSPRTASSFVFFLPTLWEQCQCRRYIDVILDFTTWKSLPLPPPSSSCPFSFYFFLLTLWKQRQRRRYTDVTVILDFTIWKSIFPPCLFLLSSCPFSVLFVLPTLWKQRRSLSVGATPMSRQF